jgi:hypothetical protein
MTMMLTSSTQAFLVTMARLTLIIAEIVLIVALVKYDLEKCTIPGKKLGLGLLGSAIFVIIAQINRILVESTKLSIVNTRTTIIIFTFALATQIMVVIRMVIDTHYLSHGRENNHD